MTSYRLRRDAFDRFRQRGSLQSFRLEQGSHSVDDLFSPSIRHRNSQCHRIVLRRRCLGGTNCCNDRLRQNVESADGAYPNASLLHERIMHERRNLGFNRRKDSGNFRLRPLEVLG
jgi:hypothetical protein